MCEKEISERPSKEDIDKAFNDALSAAEHIHEKLNAANEDTGYIIKAIKSVKPQYYVLNDVSQEDPDAIPIVASGICYLGGLGDELTALRGIVVTIENKLDSLANSTGTFALSSDSSSSMWFNPEYIQPIPMPPNRKSRDYYTNRLREIDPSLANTYEEIWQTYFGTTSDPHRASLFTMRTLFDNFFAHIAPDDEVRKSKYWQLKDGENKKQIWRSERIAFALYKNINDESNRKLLEAESEQISALYKASNSAHNRGSLDEDKASKTLLAMDSFLKDWLDYLEQE